MYNKRNILALAFMAITSTATIQADDSWYEFFVSFIWGKKQEEIAAQKEQQKPHQQYQRPDPSAPPYEQPAYTRPQTTAQALTNAQRTQVQRDVEAVIDGLFATKEQESRTQREIFAIKEKTVRCIHECTQSARTLQELRKAANYYLVECLANTVARNARLLYEQKAAKAAGQPAYNPAHLATQTEDIVKTDALKAIKHKTYGSLAFFVGQALEDRIAAKVAHDYPVPQKPAPTPSAPPLVAANEVFEVYVHEKAGRYEQSVTNIREGKVHREAECCTCMDEFGGAKMRVTLACGHSICPNCLYSWLYQQHKNSCPVCRDTIRADEFPAAYLRQYSN